MTEQGLTIMQFDLLFKNSKEAVLFIEKVGHEFYVVYANDVAKSMIDLDEITGKKLDELIPTNQFEYSREKYNEAIYTNEQINFDHYIYTSSQVKKFDTTIIPAVSEERKCFLEIKKEIVVDRSFDDRYLFMRSLSLNSELSTMILSNDGRLLEANNTFLNMFNLDISTIRWQKIYDLPLIDMNNIEELKSYILQSANGESLSAKMLTFIDQEGRLRHFVATFTPLYQDNIEVVAIFIVLQEITPYITQHQELESVVNSLNNFKRALDIAADVSITDANGIIIDVNERFVERTCYRREELIGNTHRIVGSRQHSLEFYSNLWGTITKGEVWHGEICNRTKYGVPYWVDTTIIPLLDEKGKIYQFLAIHFDVTEKKRMFTELRNIERMFKMINENTNDLIVITNEDGIILYASNAYDKKLGYTNEELIGQFYSKVLSSESVEIWNDELLTVEQNMSSKIELIHKTKNGDTVWTECNYTVVKDYLNNRGTQIIMVAREITERKEFENKLLFLAYHDSLTQLPNRRYLQKKIPRILDDAKFRKESVAIFYVDGDNFKVVNDEFGHDVGDEFIKQFGHALSKSVRNHDLVARMGGDEFAIILTGLARNEVKRLEQIEQIIQRIRKNLKAGWTIKDHHFTPTASMGIAFYPDHGEHLNELLECADHALYEIKGVSKNSYKVCE